MDIKTAWELKPGDVIETTSGFLDTVGRVRKMLWNGEFEGKTYQQAPMVRVELANVPGAFFMTPGDRVYSVVGRRGAKA